MIPNFGSFDMWWWPYVFILLVGWLPTDIWRVLGVVLSGGINEDSKSLIFVRAIATAFVAAVIAKLIIFPAGSLALTPVELRLAAAGAGFAAFQLAGKSVITGILVSEILLIGGASWIGTM